MLSLAKLSELIQARYIGTDTQFNGVSIDTRTIEPGELFVAIKGPHFDGHQFVKQAIEKGAIAVMVDRPSEVKVPQMIVTDTRLSLGRLAHVWRQQFSIPVIALTGSCGKTGTKEMIAAILRQRGPTLATQGNKNNDYGVPLTLLGLKPEHQYAVIEMGTNSPGEISYLTKIAEPTVALITNIYGQHLEGLGSLEGISREKSDIFTGLRDNGIAVINQDESFSEQWSDKIEKRHRVSYSLHLEADVCADNCHFGPEGVTFDLHTPLGMRSLGVRLIGEHVMQNALAAAAATLSIGAALDDVVNGLVSVKPVAGRFHPHRIFGGALMIDDTYNASASSVDNAMQTLSRFSGRRIFVMSNMGELGTYEQGYHSSMGELAIQYGIDHLLLTGDQEALQFTLDACDERARYFTTKEALLDALLELLNPKAMVVIKGSRSNQMETLVQALLEKSSAGSTSC